MCGSICLREGKDGWLDVIKIKSGEAEKNWAVWLRAKRGFG